MIPNPRAGEAGQPAEVPNRGVPIGARHEKMLRMFNYYYYHLQRVQRPFEEATATVERLTECWKLKEKEDQAKKDKNDIDPPKQLTKMEDVRKTLENIDHYLASTKGCSGIPLIYVVRDRNVPLPLVAPADNPDAELDPSTLKLMKMATLTIRLVRLLITRVMEMRYPKMMALMPKAERDTPPRVGGYVVNGRMVLPPGSL